MNRRIVPLLVALAGCTAGEDEPGRPDEEHLTAGPARLVPRPRVLEQADGGWRLGRRTAIVAQDEAARDAAEFLAAAWRSSTGFDLPVVTERRERGGDVVLAVDLDLDLPAEGYVLDVDADGVTVTGVDAPGLFWGVQTLRQLLPPESLGTSRVRGVDWVLPLVHVEDAPRFGWRGFMLDVARHFFPVDVVKLQIDRMVLHKLNRLHLHLTDDQGWRIEIRSWPRLHEVGGATQVGGGPGGFFTQAEFEDIVAYAAERHVTVVPEIDFPGHAHAALVAYEELNESGVSPEPYTGRPVISSPLWLDGPITRNLVADVWREVAALTPGEWVHLGGDEAVEIDDESYAAFIVWLHQLLRDEGKLAVGWDEIGPADLEPPFGIQHWIDVHRAEQGVRRGARLLASPAEHAYLDQAYEPSGFGQRWAGYVSVERSYRWDPGSRGLDDEQVLGVEGALWTELIETPRAIDHMAWPRLAALAEVGWSPREARDWEDFRERLGWHGARLDALGVRYYASPDVAWATDAP